MEKDQIQILIMSFVVGCFFFFGLVIWFFLFPFKQRFIEKIIESQRAIPSIYT